MYFTFFPARFPPLLTLRSCFLFPEIYAVSFFEGADFQLLPASFRALEADLGLSPSTLAASTLLQTLTCATFSVFWGVLAAWLEKRKGEGGRGRQGKVKGRQGRREEERKGKGGGKVRKGKERELKGREGKGREGKGREGKEGS